jgi:hypothetical protein
LKKKHVQGIFNPRFITTDPVTGITTNWDISFKFQSFKEFQEENNLRNVNYRGKKTSLPLWVNYEWELSFEDYAEGPDLIIMREIINRSRAGHKLELIPSRSEYAWRKFTVLVIPDKRELAQYPSHRQYQGVPMKGYKISFENVDPINYIDIVDPNNIQYQGEIIPTGILEVA